MPAANAADAVWHGLYSQFLRGHQSTAGHPPARPGNGRRWLQNRPAVRREWAGFTIMW